jgi:cyclase
MTLPIGRLWPPILSAVFAGSVGMTLHAQRQPGGEEADKNPLTGHLVKTGLYMFSGRTNSLLRLSANGLIVVDGPAPGHYDALLKQADRISEQPIRLVITTDHHQEHTASNTRFIADGAQILAHENVTRNLTNSNSTTGTIAPPTKTYDSTLSLTIGGIDVRLMHFGSAHTSGDSVVYFPNLKVVAVGDLYAATPDPDFSSGGSLVGWGPVLAEILKLDFDVVVPGTGPTVGRADFAAFKAKFDTLVSRAVELVKNGVPKGELMTRLETNDLGWRLTFTEAQLDGFYAELSRLN